jgi:U3 small nucleolar RNA-associated protein 12
MERGSQKLLISVSKDTLMKVWDLSTQHCIQTVVGHRCEIWSLAILSPSASDTGAGGDLSSVRVVTGGADDLLRGYRLHIPTNSSDNDAKGEGEAEKEPSNARNVADVSSSVLLGDDEKVLEYYGCVRRVPAAAIGKGVAGSVDKCARLEFNVSGTILAAQSSGKIVEVC